MHSQMHALKGPTDPRLGHNPLGERDWEVGRSSTCCFVDPRDRTSQGMLLSGTMRDNACTLRIALRTTLVRNAHKPRDERACDTQDSEEIQQEAGWGEATCLSL